jgi:hypothetical protein
MAQGFQTQVTNPPAPAIAGDFASLNPFWTVDVGPDGLVSDLLGLTVGRFCWATLPSDVEATWAEELVVRKRVRRNRALQRARLARRQQENQKRAPASRDRHGSSTHEV